MLIALCCVLGAKAQTTAETAPADTMVSVIAYFSEGDSLIYRETITKSEVTGSDTVTIFSVAETFLLTLEEETDEGYVIKYQPLGIEHISGRDNGIATKYTLAMSEAAQRVPLIFRTDECGAVQEVVNWQEYAAVVTEIIDEAIATLQQADTLVAINYEAIKGLLGSFATEDAIRAQTSGIGTLFALHGYAIPEGEADHEIEQMGLPAMQHLTVTRTYDDDADTAEAEPVGYLVNSSTHLDAPAEFVTNLVGQVAKSVVVDGKDDASGKTRHEAIEDSLAEVEMSMAMSIDVNECRVYFSDGWPAAYLMQKKVMSYEGAGRIDRIQIECINEE